MVLLHQFAVFINCVRVLVLFPLHGTQAQARYAFDQADNPA